MWRKKRDLTELTKQLKLPKLLKNKPQLIQKMNMSVSIEALNKSEKIGLKGKK